MAELYADCGLYIFCCRVFERAKTTGIAKSIQATNFEVKGIEPLFNVVGVNKRASSMVLLSPLVFCKRYPYIYHLRIEKQTKSV